jgi:hypothetical protein
MQVFPLFHHGHGDALVLQLLDQRRLASQDVVQVAPERLLLWRESKVMGRTLLLLLLLLLLLSLWLLLLS